MVLLKARRLKELILFDLDGVILDSRANMDEAWATVRNEFGITVSFEAYFAQIGRPFPDIMARLGLSERAREIEAAYRRASSQSLARTPIFSGIDELLIAVMRSGAKLGIVTSKDSARTQLVIDRLPVTFSVVMTPNATLRGKPAPDHLLFAMARCNVDPARAIFVGDMDSDAEAAVRAGLDYAHAAWGYGDVPKVYATSVASPAELQAYLLG